MTVGRCGASVIVKISKKGVTMTKHSVKLTDNPHDKAPSATSRVSPCRIDGPFAEGRTFGGKGGGGKGAGGKGPGGKNPGGKGGGGKGSGGKGEGGKPVGGKSFGGKSG